jgi:hypothetical protein
VLSDLFRGKFLDGLADVYERGELNLEGKADPILSAEREHACERPSGGSVSRSCRSARHG